MWNIFCSSLEPGYWPRVLTMVYSQQELQISPCWMVQELSSKEMAKSCQLCWGLGMVSLALPALSSCRIARSCLRAIISQNPYGWKDFQDHQVNKVWSRIVNKPHRIPFIYPRSVRQTLWHWKISNAGELRAWILSWLLWSQQPHVSLHFLRVCPMVLQNWGSTKNNLWSCMQSALWLYSFLFCFSHR